MFVHAKLAMTGLCRPINVLIVVIIIIDLIFVTLDIIMLKGKEYHTPCGVLVGCSSPLLRPWVRRWINHSSLWRTASATPDLRLPSQSQDIAAPRLVPNYTAWWQRHMCVNNLSKVVTWQRLGRELNSQPLESQANELSITPPGHMLPRVKIVIAIIKGVATGNHRKRASEDGDQFRSSVSHKQQRTVGDADIHVPPITDLYGISTNHRSRV